MSEETTQGQLDQAAPAEPEQEEASESAQTGELIADAKRYRKRAQLSEQKVSDLETQLKQMVDAKMTENEEWKALAEKRGAELADLKTHADRGMALEEALRSDSLAQLNEEDREFAKDLSTEKLLQFAKRVAPAEKVATNESSAANVAQIEKNPWDMSAEERRKHWSTIIERYKSKMS